MTGCPTHFDSGRAIDIFPVLKANRADEDAHLRVLSQGTEGKDVAVPRAP
jgi:hypothetical protein